MSDRFEHNITPRPYDGDLNDFYAAMSGEGDLAYQWQDKPHRLVYDLLAHVLALEEKLNAVPK